MSPAPRRRRALAGAVDAAVMIGAFGGLLAVAARRSRNRGLAGDAPAWAVERGGAVGPGDRGVGPGDGGASVDAADAADAAAVGVDAAGTAGEGTEDEDSTGITGTTHTAGKDSEGEGGAGTTDTAAEDSEGEGGAGTTDTAAEDSEGEGGAGTTDTAAEDSEGEGTAGTTREDNEGEGTTAGTGSGAVRRIERASAFAEVSGSLFRAPAVRAASFAFEVLCARGDSPGGRLAGVVAVDRRTGRRLSIARAAASVAVEHGSRELSRRLGGLGRGRPNPLERRNRQIRAIRPQLAAVTREHAGDPLATNDAVRELYREHGVEPVDWRPIAKQIGVGLAIGQASRHLRRRLLAPRVFVLR